MDKDDLKSIVMVSSTIPDIILRGPHGIVIKAIDGRTKGPLAVEIMVHEKEETKQVVMRNIEILSRLNCEYLPKYFGYFENGETMWIVHEFLDGVTVTSIMKVFKFEETHIAAILWEILKVLESLHKEQKVYGFLCNDNVVITEDYDVKLSNYAVSFRFEDDLYTCESDILCLGYTAVELSGVGSSSSDLVEWRKDSSPEYRDFIMKCTNKDPKSRPTAQDLLYHPFIENALDNSIFREPLEIYQKWIFSQLESVRYSVSQLKVNNKEDSSSNKIDIHEEVKNQYEYSQEGTKKYREISSRENSENGDEEINFRQLDQVLKQTLTTFQPDRNPDECSSENKDAYIDFFKENLVTCRTSNNFADTLHNQTEDHKVVFHDNKFITLSNLNNAFEEVNRTNPLMVSRSNQQSILTAFKDLFDFHKMGPRRDNI